MKKISEIVFIFTIGVLGGIFADKVLSNFYNGNGGSGSPVYITEKKEFIIEENTALVQAVERIEKSLVAVESEVESGDKIRGSGVIVTSDGLAVLFSDLAPAGAEHSFFVDMEEREYQILKRDPEKNLCLVKLDMENSQTLSFADAEGLGLGEEVFLAGKFFAKEESTIKTIINEGAIRDFKKNLIETNIFEEEEFKGSVLFNIKGEVAGLNIIGESGRVSAVPISEIREFAGI